jgi:hypothetical protein
MDAKFLVTVHAEKDSEDRLAVWKKIGPDQYKTIIGPTEKGPDSSFEEPEVSSSKLLATGHSDDYYETELFLDLPLARGRGDDDAKFAVATMSYYRSSLTRKLPRKSQRQK